jgi:hypothetical protein
MRAKPEQPEDENGQQREHDAQTNSASSPPIFVKIISVFVLGHW